MPGASFEPAPDWWLRFELQEEIDRGFDGHEDLFTPGVLRVELPARGQLGVVVSTEPAAGRDALALLGRGAAARERLVARVAGRRPSAAPATGAAPRIWCGR